jgi:ABC-type transporter Mla subunit MlaD
MKWERTDLAVGVVVIAATVVLVAALLWVSPLTGSRTYELYTEFDRIDGIARQAPVLLHGYPIGRVSSIEPHVRADGRLVFRVQMNVQRELGSGDTLHLPAGTLARLVPPSVVGTGFLVLEPPAEPGPGVLAAGATIPGVHDAAIMDQVAAMTPLLSEELVRTLATARTLMDTLVLTTSTATQTMVATTAQMAPLLATVQQQLIAAGELTQDMRGHLGALTPAAVATIDSVQGLMSDSRRLLGDVNRMMVAREPEMAGIVANLDSITALLHHTARQVSARPYRVFTGVAPPRPAADAPARPAPVGDSALAGCAPGQQHPGCEGDAPP